LALKLAEALRRVDPSLDDAALADEYARILLDNQGGLGAPGYAPVASNDTSAADLHRCAAVRERWGPKGKGAPAQERVLRAVPDAVVRASRAEDGDQEAVRAAVNEVVSSPPRTDEAPTLAADDAAQGEKKDA
jgi:hypothetical protein